MVNDDCYMKVRRYLTSKCPPIKPAQKSLKLCLKSWVNYKKKAAKKSEKCKSSWKIKKQICTHLTDVKLVI